MTADRTAPEDAREVGEVFTTDVPARLDRLPWSRFHWLVVTALGITWILDGLEVTLVGSLSGAIADRAGLGLSATEIGLSASCYIAGAVLGSLYFGRLADRLGRKRLFTVTVAVYAVATILTGVSWNFASFALFRFLTGAGIGGEYAAINSAIQELIPARRRGFTDLAINGSFWLGAALGALSAVVVLDPAIIPAERGWRLAFLVGGVLALVVIVLRRYLPESPRWLMTHGRADEAERVVGDIERRIEAERGEPLPRENIPTIQLMHRRHAGLGEVARTVFVDYAQRAVLGVTLMTAQAFLYNAIFFTYALVLTRFYDISAQHIGWFMLPFALGNLMGPLLLGRLFDSIGRKPMITATYALSGVLVAVTGLLFREGVLDAAEQTACWTVIFFVASAAASAAYLTVGESFPLETRALAIAIFYSLGTALGGIAGPLLFGALIDTGSRDEILWGYLLGAALMIGAAAVEAAIGVKAERRPLEELARPLSGVR